MNPYMSDLPENNGEPKNDPDAAVNVAGPKASAQTKQRSMAEYVSNAKVQGITNCGCAIQK